MMQYLGKGTKNESKNLLSALLFPYLGTILVGQITVSNCYYCMTTLKIMTGSKRADAGFHITIDEKGPYLVYGRPPLAQQFIMNNDKGESWYFQEGKHFSTESEPTALCRCGESHRKPYCDGSHQKAQWDPSMGDTEDRLLDNVEMTRGGTVDISDNRKYCVFARFCDAEGGVYELAEQSDDPEARRLAIREASMCPSARLTAWDTATERPYEYKYEPSLGLIEDPAIGASGGLWVRGGITVQRADGRTLEVRNRVVLCRCGQSAGKPYCDGTHAAIKWRDDLEGVPEGETVPEKVY